jgi:chitodextrinase
MTFGLVAWVADRGDMWERVQAASGSTPAFVQEIDNQVTSGTTNGATFRSRTAAGNLLAVYVIWDNTGKASVSDGAGNSYTPALGPGLWSSGKYSAQIFYATNIKGGTDTVTATFATAVKSFGIVYAHEYAGLAQTAPVDVTAAAVGTSGPLNSGLATTTTPSDLLFGAGVSANVVTAPGNGYTARATSHGNMTEDTNVSSLGSYSATASNSGGGWGMQMVAFRSAGTTSGSGDTTPPTVPTGLAATVVSSSQINLSWTASTDNVGVTGYRVYRNGTQVASTATTAYSDTNLNANTSYTYTVSAYDAAGNNSAQSASVSATTSAVTSGNYSTSFPNTEDPISEGGNWLNGKTNGLDWTDVRTTPTLAFGTQSGSSGQYDDSTAVLTGNWGPDQTVQAAVHSANQNNTIWEEVEIRLRTTITAHSITGYEINFRCTSDGSQYTEIVRWNGVLNSFTQISQATGPGIHDGDVVKAVITGSTITAYINGVQVNQATDSTYTSGSPGMGFWLFGTANNADYGFTSFAASDGSTTDTTPPSTPVNLTATVVSTSQINLSWTASTDNVGVAGYKVIRNNNQIATTTSTTFSDTTVIAGTQYAYAVSAYDASGNTSPLSAQVVVKTPSVPDTIPPSVPAGLQASNITSTSLTVSWPASTDNVAVAGYQVFRNGNQIATVSTTTYVDTGLSPQTTYAYTVSAFDYSNNVSAQSQPLAVATTAGSLTPPAFVQVNQNEISSGSKVSVAFNGVTTSGHTIVAYVIWSNIGSAAVSDSMGDLFVSVSAPNIWSGTYSAQVFYATNISGGADTVTVAFRNSVSSFGVIYVHEYSGISVVNPVDVTAAASGSSATLNSGSATTTAANDLIFGAGVSDNVVTKAGLRFGARDVAYGNITEDMTAVSAGTYSATATHNGNAWGMQMVAFRAAN